MNRIARNGGSGATCTASEQSLRLQNLVATARGRLEAKPLALFEELTGWPCHVHWAPPVNWSATLPMGATERCREVTGDVDNHVTCSEYESACLRASQLAETHGHRFSCPFGVRSFWLAVDVQGACIAVLAIYAGAAQRRRTRKRARSGDDELPERRRNAKERQRFDHAVRLLQIVADDIQQSVLAALRADEVQRLSLALSVRDRAEAHLREDLQALLPRSPKNAKGTNGHNHRQEVVRVILDHVHDHFDETMGLQQFADQLGMNTAHLSKVFSKTVGIPFRSYLKEYRLIKAESLLHRASQRVSDVAYAVGYTDPNRFRLDFKHRTGLSPSAWRDSL